MVDDHMHGGLVVFTQISFVNCRPSAGEYTSERLKELKQNALSYSTAKFADDVPVAEPLIKLQGSFKAASSAQDDRYKMGSSIAVVSSV